MQIGCTLAPENCTKINLSTQDNNWFQVYAKGEKVLFVNGNDEIDTLFVKNKKNGYTMCYGDNGNFKQYNFKRYSFILSHENLKLICYMKFGKNFENKRTRKEFLIANLYGSSEKNDFFKERIFLTTKNDSIDTYLISLKDSKIIGDTIIKSFNWSEKYGLVRYITKDESVFELLK